MTGDGSIISNGLRVTHGFNLNCDVTHNPQRLQINWDDSRFHLESLASANCSNDPNINAGQPYAGFNTYTGSGTGTLTAWMARRSTSFSRMRASLAQKGTAAYTIRDADGNLVLSRHRGTSITGMNKRTSREARLGLRLAVGAGGTGGGQAAVGAIERCRPSGEWRDGRAAQEGGDRPSQQK